MTKPKVKPIPTFNSEGAERFLAMAGLDGFRRLEQGSARPLDEPEAIDEGHFAGAAGIVTGRHQGRRQQAGRSISVVDEDLAGRKAENGALRPRHRPFR